MKTIPYIIDVLTKRKLKHRVGECKKCGMCCAGCHKFDRINKLCPIYHRRVECDEFFPINNEQIIILKKTWQKKMQEAINEASPEWREELIKLKREYVDNFECGFKFLE